MSISSRFRVSLHLSHPNRSADDICVGFLLAQRYARSVGEPRTSKKGTVLGGVHASTEVSLAVSEGVISNEDATIAEFISSALDALPASAILNVVSSGGACFFLIGIYSEDNILCDFNEEFLARLASLKIGLKLDFYGGPGP